MSQVKSSQVSSRIPVKYLIYSNRFDFYPQVTKEELDKIKADADRACELPSEEMMEELEKEEDAQGKANGDSKEGAGGEEKGFDKSWGEQIGDSQGYGPGGDEGRIRVSSSVEVFLLESMRIGFRLSITCMTRCASSLVCDFLDLMLRLRIWPITFAERGRAERAA